MNRAVLLLSVLFSLIVPLCHFSTSSDYIQETLIIKQFDTELISNEEMNTPQVVETDSTPSLSISSGIMVIYLLGVIIFLSRFSINFYRLISKVSHSKKGTYLGFKVAIFDDPISPFTFFRIICISQKDYQQNRLEKELLIHEMAHKKQLHSLDIILMEGLQIVFWFHPLIYLFKRLIKINHEYLADDFVLKSGISTKDYANKLLIHTFPHKVSNLASGFNHLLIKQRLIMLSKFQVHKSKTHRFLLLVPIVFTLFTTTAFTGVSVSENVSSVIDDDLLTPGVLYASTIHWSAEDNKVYLIGKNVRVKHGSNNVTVNGRASYLGAVEYLIFNGEPVRKDATIDIEGKKCKVVKLTTEMARRKYGAKGKKGAVEITVVQ